ncbi:hypothetical protein C2G38_2217432 [Gigaspora rosea]|uniref:Ion transport domain-containing protein n=1 Tax=Gigaspora rosea TaxID=44941 RepID=A0A397U7U9_9GLOM|nr:hypothetical protein C2G38_2217432 [Gigaspora rosea]
MNNEGESSQAPKKYTVTHNRKGLEEELIYGWQLDQDQPLKQTENESYQPISFNLDCLINLKEFNVEDGQDLVAVSNNKLVAIADSNLRITVLNLAIKKKVNLKLYLYSNYKPVIRAEFYNNKDFVMHPSREITNNNYCFFLNGSFKNLHNDKQSLTINNSISCGKIRDVKDHKINKGKILLFDKGGSLTQWNLDTLSIEKQYQLDIITNYDHNETISNLYKELLNNEASTKLDISSEEFKTLMDENIYYMLEGLQGFDKIKVLPKKTQIEKILQELIIKGNKYTPGDRIMEMKFYEGSLVKWEVNGEENVIRAFKKSDSNTWEDVDSIKLEDFLIPYSNSTYGIHMYICSCDLLHNDDLAVITSFGLFIWDPIWSTWQKDEKIKKIRVLYYMSYGDRENYIFVENSCVINLLYKIQKNKKSLLPAPDFDYLYEHKQSYIFNDHRLLLKELLDNFLDDYIKDNILMKLYRQELLEFCLNETNLMKLCGEDCLKGFLKYQFYPLAEKLYNKICKETEKDNFLEKIQLLDILNFSFEELTQYPQLLKKCLSYILFIHLSSNYEKIKYNKFFSEPHLQKHIKYLQPYFTKKIFYKDFQAVILIFPFPKFSSYPATYNFGEELIFPKHSIFSRHQFSELYKYWCGAILFPVLTSIDLLQSSTTPIWAITISILLLELKFITFFRAIEFGGTYWAMIIGVIKSSLSFFVIIGLIMFAFAHSLHILLRPNISDNLNNSDESDTNMFINLDTAYLAVYMMLTGDTSSVSNCLDKLYKIITKIQNDKWDDDIIEMPFIPNSLLRIIGETELVIKEEEWPYLLI